MIVLDASAAVELLRNSRRGLAVARWLRTAPSTTFAPAVLDLEVLQSLRRLVAARALTRGAASPLVDELVRLPVVREPHWPFAHRIWQLRDNLTAYDAAYVALAERLGARLVTCDARMARAPGHRARVEVVA